MVPAVTPTPISDSPADDEPMQVSDKVVVSDGATICGTVLIVWVFDAGGSLAVDELLDAGGALAATCETDALVEVDAGELVDEDGRLMVTD